MQTNSAVGCSLIGHYAEAEEEGIGERGLVPREELMNMDIGDIRSAVTRGWFHPKNSAKIMDMDLAEAISQEVHKLFIADKEPYLGCATTKQLIDELEARADVAHTIGEAWPAYKTVD